ncbi:hypothetical protein Pcinc_030478 [Petrolisthes cinctipes]|uniref:Uncharacterized protein n=1 Tax=Petrolisthes cinctipes TaxID=88211 RepID=A0AAE1K4E7_PETCI|nr:hypothetical protein Pcinc_030478 [Petrolisthes cinctipes]
MQDDTTHQAGGRVYNIQQPSSGPVTTQLIRQEDMCTTFSNHQVDQRRHNSSGRRTCVQHPSPIKWTSDNTTHQARGRCYGQRVEIWSSNSH